MSLVVDRSVNICRGICSATALGTPFCIGCGRLESDVIQWNGYNKDKQKQLVKEAKTRLRK